VIFDVLTTDQRSPEWFAARLGRLTGSRASDAFATVAKGEAAARRNLRTQLVLERLMNVVQEDNFQSYDMRRGTELEPIAFAAYEALTGTIVHRAGFLAHPELMAGCSVDGEIGHFTGLIEIKCPKAATHLGYLRSQRVPEDYLTQVRHCLWVTGAIWCDFISFHPAFPESLRLLITRVAMSAAERAGYELNVRQFLREVDAEFAEVSRMALVAVA